MKLKRKQLDKFRGFLAQRQELSQTIGLIALEEQRYINLLGQLDNEFKEFKKEFDDEFIRLARAVYVTNDQRADVKKRINLLLGSELVEEKSYEDYQ